MKNTLIILNTTEYDEQQNDIVFEMGRESISSYLPDQLNEGYFWYRFFHFICFRFMFADSFREIYWMPRTLVAP